MPQPLVYLDEARINAMLEDGRFLQAFPFLQVLKNQKAAQCSSCSRRAAQVSLDYNSIKQQFAQMPDPLKLQLKQLLDAAKVRIVYQDPVKRQVLKITY